MKLELTPEEILSWRYRIDHTGHAQVMFMGMPVARSRLVIWAATGRILFKGEVVHHINANKLDDQPLNLVVMTRSQHMKHHNQTQPWIGRGWQKGKPRGPRTRQKISAALKGKPHDWVATWTDERRARQSAARKVFRYSEESKQKISAGLKRHHEKKRAEKTLLEQSSKVEFPN
jgi:hypothetical protein